MTVLQRLLKIGGALLIIIAATLILRLGDLGFYVVSVFLSFALIIFGIRNLIFYFTMARHMIDGKLILYIGAVSLNFGVFSLSINSHQNVFIVSYLLGVFAFYGVIDILRAKEARENDARSWRGNLAEGIVNILFAAAAAVFGFIFGNMQALTVIYVIGLYNSALARIISAFRKSTIVYIQ